MAITVRKGSETQFDINKMLPGEFAVTTDTHKVFVCTSAGNARELASVEELQQILDVSDEAFAAFQELINAMESNDVITGLLNDIEKLKEDIKKNKGVKELTKAEYEALSEEEKNNDTVYLIKDTGVIMLNCKQYSNVYDKASKLPYDNTESKLKAEDVQAAIDETLDKIQYLSEALYSGDKRMGYAKKFGRIVEIHLDAANIQGTETKNDVILTVPEVFRPAEDTDFLETYGAKRFRIWKNGEIKFSSDNDGQKYVRGTFTYISAS